MSATGRSVAGYERAPDDFYATPYWATRAIAPRLHGASLDVGANARVLDPFAGEGAILDCFHDIGRSGIELDTARAVAAARTHTHVTCGNALDPTTPWPRATAIVTNPPYAHALEAILRALAHQAETPGLRDVAFLLRVNFLGAQKRADFHRRHPADLYILPRRPSFCCSLSCEHKRPTSPAAPRCTWGRLIPYLPTGELREPKPTACPACGGPVVSSSSDATEYAWFVWGPGRGGRWSILDVEEA